MICCAHAFVNAMKHTKHSILDESRYTHTQTLIHTERHVNFVKNFTRPQPQNKRILSEVSKETLSVGEMVEANKEGVQIKLMGGN